MQQNQEKNSLPNISICTPTFNRRPFIPFLIKCIEQQTYPREKIEWVVVDDGMDKIGDLISNISTININYISLPHKITLAKKRNLMNHEAKGDILVYMDDDDYYPPERVYHAVETLLNNPHALCVGSSQMTLYFNNDGKMMDFGPYGENHATAATMAFRKELLQLTQFNEEDSVGEEKYFLKNYTIPFAQLDTKKTILVFNHSQNSCDRTPLLDTTKYNAKCRESQFIISDFMCNNQEMIEFYTRSLNNILEQYPLGSLEYKPDVIKKKDDLAIKRKEKENQILQNKLQSLTKTCSHQCIAIQQIMEENRQLMEKNKYLETKITELISKFKIVEKK